MSPVRHQDTIWARAAIQLIRRLGTNVSEILVEIHTFQLKKMYLNISCGKWRPFCLAPIWWIRRESFHYCIRRYPIALGFWQVKCCKQSETCFIYQSKAIMSSNIYVYIVLRSPLTSSILSAKTRCTSIVKNIGCFISKNALQSCHDILKINLHSLHDPI